MRTGTGETLVTYTDAFTTPTPTPTNTPTPTSTSTPTNTPTSTPTFTPTPIRSDTVQICKLPGLLPTGSAASFVVAGAQPPNVPVSVPVSGTVGTSCTSDAEFASAGSFVTNTQVGIVETAPTGVQIGTCTATVDGSPLTCGVAAGSATFAVPGGVGGRTIRVVLSNVATTAVPAPSITPTATPVVFFPAPISPAPPLLPPPPPPMMGPPPGAGLQGLGMGQGAASLGQGRPPGQMLSQPPMRPGAPGSAAGVPVIPEADSVVLLGGGLALLGAFVAVRRWRRREP